jgi:hypothetical protein
MNPRSLSMSSTFRCVPTMSKRLSLDLTGNCEFSFSFFFRKSNRTPRLLQSIILTPCHIKTNVCLNKFIYCIAIINIGMMASGSKLLITTTKHNERLTHAYCYLNQLKLSEKRLRLQKRTTRCPHIYFTLQSAFHNYSKPYLKTSQTHSAARSHSPAPHINIPPSFSDTKPGKPVIWG